MRQQYFHIICRNPEEDQVKLDAKILAAKKGITLKKLVMEAIKDRLKREKENNGRIN